MPLHQAVRLTPKMRRAHVEKTQHLRGSFRPHLPWTRNLTDTKTERTATTDPGGTFEFYQRLLLLTTPEQLLPHECHLRLLPAELALLPPWLLLL